MGIFHHRRGGSRPGSSSRRVAGVRRERRPGVEGLESRALLSGITEFSSVPTNAIPYGITGGGGYLWVGEPGTGQIARIDPSHPDASPLQITASAGSEPYDLTVDAQGRVWFTDAGLGAVGVYNPGTQTVTEYQLPNKAGAGATYDKNASPAGITVGTDGNIWFLTQRNSLIGKIDPGTAPEPGGIVPLSTPAVTAYSSGLASSTVHDIVGADGKLWISLSGNDQVGVFDPKATGAGVTPITLNNTGTLQGLGIALGSDGKLWVGLHDTSFSTGMLVRFDPANPADQAQFATPAGTGGGELAAAADGNLYVGLGHQSLGMIDPHSSAPQIQTFSTNLGGSFVNRITPGPDGNVWFTDNGLRQFGALPITQLQVALPSGITAGSPFSVTVTDRYIYGTGAGTTDTLSSGDATLRLASGSGSLGGTLTAKFVNGVATFTGLTIDQGGGYTLQASSSGLISTTTGAFSVAASQGGGSQGGGSQGGGSQGGGSQGGGSQGGPQSGNSAPTPTIVSEQIKLVYLRHNRKGKPIGKPVVGLVLRFNTPMGASAGAAAGYQVAWASTRRVKRQLTTLFHPTGIAANYLASDNSVTLTTSLPTRKFAKGGEVLIVSPGSLQSDAGVSLGGATRFMISPKARGIAPA